MSIRDELTELIARVGRFIYRLLGYRPPTLAQLKRK